MASYPYYRTPFTSPSAVEISERLPSGISFPYPEIAPGDGIKAGGYPMGGFSYFQRNVITDPEKGNALCCLPLLDVTVDVDVVSTVSRTLLTQTFANFSQIVIKEAKYSFPLYDGASVIAFRCEIGDEKMLEGRIKPKAEAQAEYKHSVAEQRVAALLEEHTPEIFETNLGNILPEMTVKVDITYVNELKPDIGGEGVLVTIPTSIAPRYGTPPSGYVSGSSTQTAQTGLRIAVHVTAPVPIRKLESRTHPISVEMGIHSGPTPAPKFSDLAASPGTVKHDPKKACATLSDRWATLGRDFVLLVHSSGSDFLAPRALMELASGDTQSAMMVTIAPRHLFASCSSIMQEFRGEIIFVADRSGSMNGAKIATLREALKFFLKSLPEDCSFNIYSFGSTYSSLWAQSSRYSQETLDEAMLHVSNSFNADMGGTELLSALKEAARQRVIKKDFTSQIILLTDGEVWNTKDTIGFVEEFCRASQNTVRFFALGIGDVVSHHLIEGIGRVGGGFGEVVAVDAQGKWESRVLRILKGALMPTNWNCELELGDTPTAAVLPDAAPESRNYIQAPYCIPPIHSFSRQSVFFLLERKVAEKLKSITVKSTASSGQQVSTILPVECVPSPWNVLHYLAAKATVLDLESGRSWMHAGNGTYSRTRNTLDKAVRHEAERLGMLYHVSSRWTSFIATDSERSLESSTMIYKSRKPQLKDLTRPRPRLPVPVGEADLDMPHPSFDIDANEAADFLCASSFPSADTILGRPTKRKGASEGSGKKKRLLNAKERRNSLQKTQKRRNAALEGITPYDYERGLLAERSSSPETVPPGTSLQAPQTQLEAAETLSHATSSPQNASPDPLCIVSEPPSFLEVDMDAYTDVDMYMDLDMGMNMDMVTYTDMEVANLTSYNPSETTEIPSHTTLTPQNPPPALIPMIQASPTPPNMQFVATETLSHATPSPQNSPLDLLGPFNDESSFSLNSAATQPKSVSSYMPMCELSSSPEDRFGDGQLSATSSLYSRTEAHSGYPSRRRLRRDYESHNVSSTERLESHTQPCALSDFVAAQRAAGSFRLSSPLLARLTHEFKEDVNQKMSKLLEILNEANVSPDTDDAYEIIHTVMSIFLIKQKFPESHELWELIIGKAERWLARRLDDGGVWSQLFQAFHGQWPGETSG